MNYLNRHIRQPTHCICTIGIAQQHSSGVVVTTANRFVGRGEGARANGCRRALAEIKAVNATLSEKTKKTSRVH